MRRICLLALWGFAAAQNIVDLPGRKIGGNASTDGPPCRRKGAVFEAVDVDKIVTPAAMGIHLSTAVSLMTDIPLVVDIDVATALLGGPVEVGTPQGKVRITVPPYTSSGKKLRLRGKGLADDHGNPQDLMLRLRIVVPETLDEQSKALIGPLVEARWEPASPLLGGRLRLQGSGVMLNRSESQFGEAPYFLGAYKGQNGVDSSRASVKADWRASNIIGPGLKVSPFVQARGDAYSIKTFIRPT